MSTVRQGDCQYIVNYHNIRKKEVDPMSLDPLIYHEHIQVFLVLFCFLILLLLFLKHDHDHHVLLCQNILIFCQKRPIAPIYHQIKSNIFPVLSKQLHIGAI
jgi:hypothetical protein